MKMYPVPCSFVASQFCVILGCLIVHHMFSFSLLSVNIKLFSVISLAIDKLSWLIACSTLSADGVGRWQDS